MHHDSLPSFPQTCGLCSQRGNILPLVVAHTVGNALHGVLPSAALAPGLQTACGHYLQQLRQGLLSFQSHRLRPPVWGQGHYRSRQAQSHRLRTSQCGVSCCVGLSANGGCACNMPDFTSLSSRAASGEFTGSDFYLSRRHSPHQVARLRL